MPSPSKADLSGIWGAAPDDVYAVGKRGTILHFDGQHWTQVESGSQIGLIAIWGSGGQNVFAVGDESTILQHNGVRWQRVSQHSFDTVYNAVWGSGPNDVYVLGHAGVIANQKGEVLHYDGETWSHLDIGIVGPEEGEFAGVWGTSSRDVYLVGAKGVIVHFDGETWRRQDSGTDNQLAAVGGSKASGVLVVGGSTVLQRRL